MLYLYSYGNAATYIKYRPMINVFCVNTGTSQSFPEGMTLMDILPHFNIESKYPIIAAKVNNVTQGLKFRVFNSRQVEFLDYTTYIGRSVYCNSLCFLLCKAAGDVFPGCRVVLRRPISKGYFCSVTKADNTVLSYSDLDKITARMKELVDADLPFRRHEVETQEAIRIFGEKGYEDKIKLLQTTGDVYVNYYTLDGTPDHYYEALLPSTGYMKVWSLTMYKGGLLLRVPNRHAPEELAPFSEQPKTFEVFSENLKWNRIMGLDNVGDVNLACQRGEASDLIKIAEALQEKKIVQIAEEIESRVNDQDAPVKLVLITGPSSSGKSTFCKRLSIQLKACGIRPISFSTDDYFVNRLDTPRLPDGSFDFDNFDTVDHAYLQSDVMKLLNGETVEVPEYNFVTGLREFNGKKLKLEPGSILDDHNCIPTSDNRLLRRIMRDFNKGAFTARESIMHWPNVRRSEVQWIYPYQECADVLFNSAYLVEFAVVRAHAERILMTVPKNCPEYSEAHRLKKFLSYFTPVSDKEVPSTSMLRSFIGGSSL